MADLIDSLFLTAPDDFHIHLRDGDLLQTTVFFASKTFRRVMVMPNIIPPVKTVLDAMEYRDRINAHVASSIQFTAYMTLYLTESLSPADIVEAKSSGIVIAVKWYPAGATTNSHYGVKSLDRLGPVLEAMQDVGLTLCVHGEVTDPSVDIFDRERVFIDEVLRPLIINYPRLRVVMEHITTSEAVDFVISCGDNVAATITPQHLLYNRSDIFKGGICPHMYCLPILKRETHRMALLNAATSGNSKFFLGSDSAPHAVERKESSCGCAGIFSSHAALCLYAEAFDSVGKLTMLEDFSSTFGARFYGLPRNEGKVLLQRESWEVPETYQFGKGQAVRPLRANELIHWKLYDHHE